MKYSMSVYKQKCFSHWGWYSNAHYECKENRNIRKWYERDWIPPPPLPSNHNLGKSLIHTFFVMLKCATENKYISALGA